MVLVLYDVLKYNLFVFPKIRNMLYSNKKLKLISVSMTNYDEF